MEEDGIEGGEVEMERLERDTASDEAVGVVVGGSGERSEGLVGAGGGLEEEGSDAVEEEEESARSCAT